MNDRTAAQHARAHQRDDRRAAHRRRGVVLVITLLALVFLAALVFYVFNLGAGTRARIRTQNAADAAATAGAGWVARSMNTVAMNNVGMTRQLALVNALDSMPKTVQFTYENQRAMLTAVRGQLDRGAAPADQHILDELHMIEQDLARQVSWLEQVHQFFNESGFDVRNITYYNAPDGGRGQLWRAMLALDAYNQATLDAVGPVAQTAAVRAAEVNLAKNEGSDAHHNAGNRAKATGLLAPALPSIPWQRGEFRDFRGPMLTGLTERARDTALRDDWHKYRGPFDAVFGWRHFDKTYASDGPGGGGGGSVDDGYDSDWSGGGPTPRRPRRVIGIESYSPYGMHEWLVNRFHWLNHRPNMNNTNPLGSRGPLKYSGFNRHLSEIAGIKLDYLWQSTETQQVIDPHWLTSFIAVRNREETGGEESQPHQYRFIELHYRQLRTSAGNGPIEFERWSINNRPGYKPPGLTRRHDYIWRDEQVVRLPDRDINDDDILEQRRVYYWHYYIFGGGNVGEDVDVGNPYNANDPNDLPAPVDFKHDQVKPTDATRRDRLTFLAVARQPHVSPMWSSAFDRNRPEDEKMQVAVAQARVFNNHSWDLWTQMWHAQLEPVEDLDHWLPHVADVPGAAGQAPALDAGAADDMYQHLKRTAPLDEWMAH